MSETETQTSELFAAIERMRRPVKEDGSDSESDEENIIRPIDKVLDTVKVIVTQLLEGYVMKQPEPRVFPYLRNTGIGSIRIIQPGLSFFFFVQDTGEAFMCFYKGGAQKFEIKTTDDLAEFCNKNPKRQTT